MLHKLPGSVVRSLLTLVPALGGERCDSHAFKDASSVPGGTYGWPIRGWIVPGERALVLGICWLTIHELYYFARGRKEVGGANLPILDYLVMEKK